MFSIIVAFHKLEDAKNLKNVLKRNGYDDILACNSASQVISAANELDAGIVICGYRLTDMHYSELYGYLPREFSMLLVASPAKLDECLNQDIICLGMPIRAGDLIHSIESISHEYDAEQRSIRMKGKKKRREREVKIINEAKQLLIERNHMTEEEAHRYIQKVSMDSGNTLVESAEMVLAINM